MTWPAVSKNAMLDGLTVTHASLHTAHPGTTGASEVSGGSYARKSIVVNVASGGARAQNAALVFDVPACTVRFVGYWNDTVFVGSAPNGGATPKNFMAVHSSDLVYSASHGFADTDKVVFVMGTAPGGLTTGTTYYVRDATTDSFKVAATLGGTAINITSAAGYQCAVCSITEAEYFVGGQHTLTTSTFTIPD